MRAQDVRGLSLAWRMPPSYYDRPNTFSALASVIGLRYTPTTEVLVLDCGMLLFLGLVFRVLAYFSLMAFNRNKRGLPSINQTALYLIVNPLDDYYRRRREEAARKERLARARESARRPSLSFSHNPFLPSEVEYTPPANPRSLVVEEASV